MINDVVALAWTQHSGEPVRVKQGGARFLGQFRPGRALLRHLGEARRDLRGPQLVERDFDERVMFRCRHGDLWFQTDAQQAKAVLRILGEV